MKFIIVDTIPERKYRSTLDHKTRDMLEAFSNSRTKIVRVDISDGSYENPLVAYNRLTVLVKMFKYPIKVILRNGDVYLKHLI